MLVLIYDRRFLGVALATFALVAGVGLLLVPMWRMTPQGFVPVVRISLLDFFQARSLSRTAEAAFAKAQIAEGMTALVSAVGNNPGDVALGRRYLERLTEYGLPSRDALLAWNHGGWLLRLTRTNLTDLENVARLYERFWMSDLVVETLEREEARLTPALETSYAKALFLLGKSGQFGSRLGRLVSAGCLTTDPDLALFRAAYHAGWTDGESAREGQRMLDQARSDRPQWLLANRLQLIVSGQREDAQMFGVALEALSDRRESFLSEHVAYARLLLRADHREAALEHLHNHILTPRYPAEALQLLQLYHDVGEPVEVYRLLRRCVHVFPRAESVWVAYATMLQDQKAWIELANLAMEMRAESNPARNSLLAYSYFLEGLCDTRQGRAAAGLAAFEKALRSRIDSLLIAGRMANGLHDLGQSQLAHQLLLGLRETAAKDPGYWQLLARTAHELKDVSLLMYATATAYRLQPDSIQTLQDYGAALITARTLPQEAVGLTLRFRTLRPSSAAARVNHAAALAQNHRYEEARVVLSGVKPSQLSKTDRSGLSLVWVDVYAGLGEAGNAIEAASQVDRSLLFSTESAWLDNTLRALGSSAPAPTASARPQE